MARPAARTPLKRAGLLSRRLGLRFFYPPPRQPDCPKASLRQCTRSLSLIGMPHNLQPHYNIAPTMSVDVVRLDREGRRELVSMRWGLVPYFWKKTLKEAPA
jgi:putative SOS response-associated peptidase YedK